MWVADSWQDYELLDTGDGMKLERWKDILLLRPDPQVIWPFTEQINKKILMRYTNVLPPEAVPGIL